MKISGSVVQSFIVCPRQTWLMSRNICGDQSNDFLEIGRIISENSYVRNKKEIIIDNNKIDFLVVDSNTLVIVETKKSSKKFSATEAQLYFYLYSNRNKFENVKGEIRIPKEKKVIELFLTEEKIKFVQDLIMDIEKTIKKENAPAKQYINACKSCSYLEFCWS